jgi:hypothetical protein
MRTLLVLALLGTLWLAAVPFARAQTAPPVRTYPRVAAVSSLGWYSAMEDAARGSDSWYNSSLNRGFGAGLHWTEHLITAVEAGWTGEGEVYGSLQPPSSLGRLEGFARHTYRARQLALGQRYQFGHNAWVHPDVGAGALIEWVERGGEAFPFYDNRGRIIEPGGPIAPTTDRRVSAFVSTGLKTYVSERAFIRSDLRLGLTRELRHVLVNIGFGIDF